jgi:hypothetical protein
MTAENGDLLADPSPFEVEIAVMSLERYKSPGSDQILVEMIQAEGRTLLSQIHKLIIQRIRPGLRLS